MRHVLRYKPHLGLCALVALVLTLGCESEGDSPAKPRVSSDEAQAALAAAQDYFAQQSFANAEMILDRLIEQAPSEYRAHELLGQVRYAQAQLAPPSQTLDREALLDDAYASYRRALSHCPDQEEPTIRAGLEQSAGEMAAAAGRDEDALIHFQQAREIDPTNPKHPLYVAQFLLQDERHDEATEALNRVLSLDPNEAYAHASLASIAITRREWDSAIAHIETARRISPDDLSLRVQEARVRRQCGQPRHGAQLLVNLAGEIRATPAVAGEIAACFVAMDDLQSAAAAWEHRYRFDPDDWRAAVRIGELEFDAGDRPAARYWLRQAELAAPEAPEVLALADRFAAPDNE